jgi:hypothetical protein
VKRIKEFLRVVREERGSISLPAAVIVLARLIINLLPYWYLAQKHEKLEWMRRYKACYNCPVFDPRLKRCRPYKNSDQGCGCYTPFSNLVYDECWGRINYGKAIGWSAYDPESWLIRIRDGQGDNSRG